jgi:aspartate aminotransferase
MTASLTPLQQRLEWVASHPGQDWVLALENVPRWDVPPVLPADARDLLPWDYSSSRGAHELIEQVCRREHELGRAVANENVLVTHGAMFGIGLLCRHLRARGFRTLVCHAPVLGSIHDLARDSGVRPVLTDVDELAPAVDRCARDGATAVYVNTPHNPTGAVLDDDVLAALLDRADGRHVAVLLDCVYDGFDFSPGPPRGFPVDTPGLFLVNSLSKNYGAPGLRVGWIVANPNSVQSLTVRMEYETIGVAGPSQRWAADLIGKGNMPLVDCVRRGREMVADWWAEVGDGTPVLGRGGTQAWVPAPPQATGGEFADLLLREFGLVMVGSESYAGVRGTHVRVPLGYPADHLRLVLALLDKAFAAAAATP